MQNRGIRVIQNAWIVPDLDQAINAWLTASGIGPFYVIRRLRQTVGMRIWVGGELQTSDASVGYAQAGDLQIELIERHPNEHSSARKSGPPQFHHISIWAEDFEACRAQYLARGKNVIMEGVVGPKETRFGYIDTNDELGCLTEFTQRTKSMERLYALVAGGARDWDGSNPIRELTAWPS